MTCFESIVSNPLIEWKCKVNTKEKPCAFTPKVSFTFNKDIPRPYITFKIVDIESGVKIVEQTLYLCTLTETIGLDVVMKILWEKILKVLDMPLKCPLLAVR